MLPLNERIHTKAHFEALYRNGKPYRGKFVRLIVLKDAKETSRAGFIVSKKVSKKAVVRNKVKRRMRFAYEQFSWVRQSHVFVLFIASSDALNASYSELVTDMEMLLQKAGLNAQVACH